MTNFTGEIRISEGALIPCATGDLGKGDCRIQFQSVGSSLGGGLAVAFRPRFLV